VFFEVSGPGRRESQERVELMMALLGAWIGNDHLPGSTGVTHGMSTQLLPAGGYRVVRELNVILALFGRWRVPVSPFRAHATLSGDSGRGTGPPTSPSTRVAAACSRESA
jgi:hypothetical protein